AKPTSQPVFGYGDDNRPVLPGDMEKHYAEYLKGLPPVERAEELTKYTRNPGEFYYGPGVFKLAKGEHPRPGYDGKSLPGVILGRDTIFNRQASGEYERGPSYPMGVECRLTMLPVTRGGSLSTEPPPNPTFRYVDDSRTGIHEIDSRNVYV